MYHNLRTILYHGTVSEIEQVDVKLGRGRKDFGKGFYMAVSKRQAVGMMHKKYREAVRRSRKKQEVADKLTAACDKELEGGKDMMYEYINKDIV